MRRLAGLLLAAAVVASGCGSFLAETAGGTREEAAAVATTFLGALRARDRDTAWSLVYPLNRSLVFEDDRGQFNALLERIDLADVRWQVIDVDTHDGRYRVNLALDPFIVDEALGTFVQIVETDGAPTHATIQVRIEPFGGSRGVYAR